jgi:hypothetical protein
MVAASDRFRELQRANARLQQALGGDDATAAGEALKACRARAWPEVAPLYGRLAGRITETA